MHGRAPACAVPDAPGRSAQATDGHALAELAGKPFPPGEYPVVVVGSGPGGLQLSYSLRRYGIEHAVISADPGPGGMFRKWPFFQRLLSWTKPYAPVERGTRWYERYDWNSLIPDEDRLRAIQPRLMDGTSYFPARAEMEENLGTFAREAGIAVRYGCTWESTRREGDRLVLTMSDGEYRCRIAVFAIGKAQPWKPDIPGLDLVPHYAETRAAETYRDRRIFIIGKETSAFELANGFLPWARQIILGSSRQAQLSVVTNSLVGVRARYVQPYEDYVLGGGVVLLNAKIDEVTRNGNGFRVRTSRSDGGGTLVFEVDDVIATTGFSAPLRDLPALGASTFGRNADPAQTPFWESIGAPGIYFAGTITQGAPGLKKNGLPANSGAVHGARYNARVLARHLAQTYFGIDPARPALKKDDVLSYLLSEVTRAPELWHQKSYLARTVLVDPRRGIIDDGILPLQHFVDSAGPDGLAIAVEANPKGEIYPAVYVRNDNALTEHLLPPNPLLDFETAEHRAQLGAALAPLLGAG
ncbi:MAG TPA: NAD(P)-binding domain-containing protein [Candidatus Limnocylindria bacterium]|nr:NAD(P)-binding domain-containing protein [Candidatus Limnocylindria bacterium]